MTVWDSIKKILRSEGADLKDGLDGARDKLDEFLTEKEQERAATPKERMDMITDDMSETEDKFDRIIEKAEGRTHEQTAESELRDALGGKSKPTPAPETPSQVAPAAASATPPGNQADSAADPAVAEQPAAEKAAAETAAAEQAAAEKAAAERAAEEEAKRRAARQAADAKFEEQKAKAGDLLDELRGELGIDGDAS